VKSDRELGSAKTCHDSIESRWLRTQEEVIERDGHVCSWCGTDDHKLIAHPAFYCDNLQLTEYRNCDLITVCEECIPVISGLMIDLQRNLLAGLRTPFDVKLALSSLSEIICGYGIESPEFEMLTISADRIRGLREKFSDSMEMF
jgi:hypothetical protein